jgi:DNA-binding NarL/FixJ family response regulator
MRTAAERGFPVSLLVAEHSLMACQLMEAALRRNRHFSVVASALDSVELLAAYRSAKPDVCVISAALRDGPVSGLRAARELRALHPDVRTILLLNSADRPSVVDAFRAGARGLFSRDEPIDVLTKCIYKVHGGDLWASTQQLQYLVESLADVAPASITDAKGASLLTPREQMLVDLVAEGRTNRDISRELRLSEHTVRNYLFRIFNKLGTSNRLELAIYAINQRDGSRSEVAEKH